jgi:hypothetical protein
MASPRNRIGHFGRAIPGRNGPKRRETAQNAPKRPESGPPPCPVWEMNSDASNATYVRSCAHPRRPPEPAVAASVRTGADGTMQHRSANPIKDRTKVLPPPRPRYTRGVDQLRLVTIERDSHGYARHVSLKPSVQASAPPKARACPRQSSRPRRALFRHAVAQASRARPDPARNGRRPPMAGAHAMARGFFREVPPHAHAATPRRRAPALMRNHRTMSRHRACRTRERPWQRAASSSRSGLFRRISG